MVDILFIFGTRPEAIKLSPIINLAQSDTDLSVYLCCTGQHDTLLSDTLDALLLEVDCNLNVMKINQNLSSLSMQLLGDISKLLKELKPKLIVVHGDTTTAFIASLVAFYNKVPVAHVEAGLRTHDLYSPYPEEFNRQAISLISELNFAPTNTAKTNLKKIGVKENSIWVTGNTAIDTIFQTLERIQNNEVLRDEIDTQLDQTLNFNWKSTPFILMTGHRRENFGENFNSIFRGIESVLKKRRDIFLVFPIHLNPNVRNEALKALRHVPNAILTDPLQYTHFIRLMAHAKIIISDSGGIQEEAPSLNIPVLVTRNTTERTEAVETGAVKLVNTDADTIFENTMSLLEQQSLYKKMAEAKNPFGDGYASKRIFEQIKLYISRNKQ